MAKRKMLRFTVLLTALFLCGSVRAGLEGEYQQVSGPDACPEGTLHTLVLKEDKSSRVFLFGSRHSWPMDMKDVSKGADTSKGGCSYHWEYEKSENKFVNTTTRTNCPKKEWEGVATTTIVSQGTKLTYEYDFEKKENIKCEYKKVAEVKESTGAKKPRKPRKVD